MDFVRLQASRRLCRRQQRRSNQPLLRGPRAVLTRRSTQLFRQPFSQERWLWPTRLFEKKCWLALSM